MKSSSLDKQSALFGCHIAILFIGGEGSSNRYIQKKKKDVGVEWFRTCRKKKYGGAQSTCGVGIVRGYYKLRKFNVLEAARGRGDRDDRNLES